MASLPDVALNTDLFQINLTVVLSIIAFCLASMGTIIRIYGGKKEVKSEDLPGNTPACTQHKETLDNNSKAINNVTEDIQELKTQMATIRVEIDNSNKTVDEIKSDYKGLTNKLDNLLKQLLDLLS